MARATATPAPRARSRRGDQSLRIVMAFAFSAFVVVGCSGSDDSASAPSESAPTALSSATGSADLRDELELTFTPVIGSFIGDETAAVLGSDGQWHVVYEVMLTNARTVPASINSLSVLDFDDTERELASFSADELTATQLSVRPRDAATLEPDGETLAADDDVLEPNESMLVFIELTFASEAEVPDRIVHRLIGEGATNPGSTEPAPIEYLMVPWDISTRTTPVIGPPLEGDNWVVINGCCSVAGAHRPAVQTVNGALIDSQRFAIDWMQIGDNGMFFDGDPEDVESWHNYGAPVLAVADGTVVEVVDELPDQVVGTLPDPATITLETVDGNHVILDLGNGVHAFYAHLKEGSVAVEVGDKVSAGQQLGDLGNSGNTSAPHLHLHLMNDPSALGSVGVPMTFDDFAYVGGLDPEQWATGTDALDDVWTIVDTQAASDRAQELPLDLSIINFGAE